MDYATKEVLVNEDKTFILTIKFYPNTFEMKEKMLLNNNNKNIKSLAQLDLETYVENPKNSNIANGKITATNNCENSYVLMIKGNNYHNIIHLEDDLYEVGRRPDAHIIIPDKGVSRYHATIIREFDPLESVFCYKIVNGDYLSGKKNTNGLVINNQYYKAKYLKNEDIIKFSNNVQAKFFVVNKKFFNENSLINFENDHLNQTTIEPQSEANLSNQNSLKNINLLSDLYNKFTNTIKNIGIRDLNININVNISTSPVESESEQDSSTSNLEDNSNSSKAQSNKSQAVLSNQRNDQEKNSSSDSVNSRAKQEELNSFIQEKLQEASILPIHGYHVIESIGKGRFSEVYQAIEHRTKKLVALKILSSEIAIDLCHKDSFMVEIEKTRSLKHPNIVKLLDYGFSQGIFYCAVEYCEQGNLFNLREQKTSPLTAKKALSLIMPILEGLQYAHEIEIPYLKQQNAQLQIGKGIVHKNLHPNNILLTQQDGKVVTKIADFGISRAFKSAGLNGLSPSEKNLEGMFQFMPKEQLINFKYPKPALDVWSVAACLYYLLTFEYPRDFYKGDSHPLMTVIQTKPTPIKQHNPNIPDQLAEIIDLALEDSGTLYFQSAKQFRQALLEAIKLNKRKIVEQSGMKENKIMG